MVRIEDITRVALAYEALSVRDLSQGPGPLRKRNLFAPADHAAFV